MTAWIIAWNNLRYNKIRTFMALLVIVIAVSSLLSLKGYINFSSDGMRLGFISQNGALQIAHEDFWSITSDDKPYLNDRDYKLLTNVLDNTYGVASYQRLLSISGIIGTAYKSKIFSGDAYEIISPSIYQMSDTGTNIIEDGIFVGKDLAEYLGVNPNLNSVVSLMSSGANGIALTSLPVAATLDIGNRDANNIFAFMTLKSAHDFYGIDSEFDRLRVDVADIDNIPKIKTDIENILKDTKFVVKDWDELAPNYREINAFNEQLNFISTFILSLFILTSITQILHMSFFERMGELGTLRAIGLTPKKVFLLLINETTLMAIIGIAIGTLLAFAIVYLTKTFFISFRPPMGSIAYRLILIIKLKDILTVNSMIFIVILLSGFFPAYKAVSRPVVEVMHHV